MNWLQIFDRLTDISPGNAGEDIAVPVGFSQGESDAIAGCALETRQRILLTHEPTKPYAVASVGPSISANKRSSSSVVICSA
jgi:hypothetical protein